MIPSDEEKRNVFFSLIPECVARVPVSFVGPGVFTRRCATVRVRPSQNLVTGVARHCAPSQVMQRRGTSVVLCDRRNTFARSSQNEIHGCGRRSTWGMSKSIFCGRRSTLCIACDAFFHTSQCNGGAKW